MKRLEDCWFLTGPTASGKSAVGHELAPRLDAEIVAMDSMSLYRGMDIGTAKPDAAALREVPYHLLDVLEPNEEYSLAQYVAAAWKAVSVPVLVVYGTSDYISSIADDDYLIDMINAFHGSATLKAVTGMDHTMNRASTMADSFARKDPGVFVPESSARSHPGCPPSAPVAD